MTPPAGGRRRFWIGVVAIAAAALVVRIVYIWGWRRGLTVGGDSFYYHEGANLLADGKGFIDPFQYVEAGKTVAAADHPPLYIVYLAAFSFVGLTGATAHMVASALAGVATVVVVALVGRELGGARLGLIAGTLVAFNANFWAYDGGLESETIAQLAVALVLLTAYLWWRAPSVRRAILCGACIALGALARAELIALPLLLVVPLVVKTPGLTRGDRVRHLLAAWGATAVLIAPWCVYNLTRFEEPTLLSSNFGFTLDSSACDETYYGDNLGYWSRQCVFETEQRAGLPPDVDRSRLDRVHRENAIRYIDGHLSRLPVVVAARLGRITGVWRLHQQVQLDNFLGGREIWVVWSSWGWFWGSTLLAVPGVLILRRRHVPVCPLVALPVLAAISTSVFFALFRYRAAAEVALVLLAAVAIDAAIDRWFRGSMTPA